MTARPDVLDPGAAVLALLSEAGEQFLSGAELGAALGVSRAAVWKRIEQLRGTGYAIEARPRVGYRLQEAPDILVPTRVRQDLHVTRIGRELHHHVAVASTMTEAARLAEAQAPEGTVVVAEQQTAGRGRLGRTWHSAPGLGIWMTVILRPPLSPMELGPLTLMAAVAVADGIADATGLHTGIKWPNDLLADGKKLCGMLTELVAEQDAVRYVLLGIGINVHHSAADFPAELAGTATSIREAAGHPVDRVAVFRSVLTALDREYGEALTDGFAPVLERWRRGSVTLGCPVTVSGPARTLRGTAEAVTPAGGLLLRLEDGRCETVLSGDVTLSGSGR